MKTIEIVKIAFVDLCFPDLTGEFTAYCVNDEKVINEVKIKDKEKRIINFNNQHPHYQLDLSIKENYNKVKKAHDKSFEDWDYKVSKPFPLVTEI